MADLKLAPTCSFDNCVQWREKGEKAIALTVEQGLKTFKVDCAELERFDSSVLSVMFCWLRAAKAARVMMQFEAVGEGLLRMMRLYGVHDPLMHDSEKILHG
jgi:ABC-type transporter Mla MlaB component